MAEGSDPAPAQHTGSGCTSYEPVIANYANRLTYNYMCNDWRSDIAFHIEQGDLTIPAHSLIVARGSPKLRRLCVGTGQSDDQTPPLTVIRVPAIAGADSFWVMLRYLYGNVGDNIGLTVDNAAEVLCLADHFELRLLLDYSQQSLLPEIGVHNVGAIYSRVRWLDAQLVAHKCWQVMLCNPCQVMSCALDIFDGDAAKIAEFLRSNELRVADESELFQALCVWADTQAYDTLNISSATSRRQRLQDQLRHVRFGCMTVEQFGACIRRAEKGFFGDTEVALVMQQIVLGSCWVGRANPFEMVDMDANNAGENNSGRTSQMRSLPPPYWCSPRGPFESDNVSE